MEEREWEKLVTSYLYVEMRLGFTSRSNSTRSESKRGKEQLEEEEENQKQKKQESIYYLNLAPSSAITSAEALRRDQ